MYTGYIICSIAIVIAVIIAIIAQGKVQSAYNAYKDKLSSIDLTGAELANRLAVENGLALSIRSTSGTLSDHYDPRDKSINISSANYNSKSIAAQAIVAHEFGHAMQHAQAYLPFKVRQAVVKISNFVSTLLLPMILIGLLIELLLFVGGGIGNIIIYVYVGIYTIAVIANLVTLPVEFNASSRAKKLLEGMGANSAEDMQATDKVLNAAAMTYVASLLVSLAYLLRLLYILRIFNRD